MKITLKQLKQLIKEEVSRKMLLEYEEAVIINPETGAILKVNDENQARVIGQAEEGNSEHVGLPGYEQWEEGGFKRPKREEPSGPRTGLFRSRADDMEVDW
jgi:hypothetical protein